ncbi:Origin recognition complex subunit 4 [Sphaceloma murrayae]|uniref:Origin recognition complex subunit 4 n=1 Tax=Sphaceloma murrayae TaxID=2082308 RepID=A0A2K1QMC5_9PEZI|nr:Origin recognition complex subunit 4 [Sphaceloma murrayae]
MSERASKRRKLDTGASPLPQESSASAKLAEQRRTRKSDYEINDVIVVAVGNTNGAAPLGTQVGRARKGDAPANAEGVEDTGRSASTQSPKVSADSKESVVEQGTTNGRPKAGNRRSRRSQASEEKVGGDDSTSHVDENSHGNGKDVEIQDALDKSEVGNEDAMDLDAPRTSGRKRQISKKLEEAQEAGIMPGKSSPAARNRSNPVNGTPVGSVRRGRVSQPGSAPRSARSSAAKKKTLPDEIPDSEPEAETDSKSIAVLDRTGTEEANTTKILSPTPMRSKLEAQAPPDLGATAERPKDTPSVVQPPKKARRSLTKQLTAVSASKPQDELPKKSRRTSRSLDAGQENVTVAEDMPREEPLQLDGTDATFHHMSHIKSSILRKLRARPRQSHVGPVHPLVGLDSEHAKVANLIEQTITAGESNSMVLIGARGSGKSALIDNVIRQQRTTHGDDFHVVRLSGFIHTDDKIAIREIWRQLGREMDIEDDSQVKNYADTLTTLLALLSHPSETGQELEGRIAKSVVIILDEFDLFTTHPRQTLLYNLFDIAQSRKAPIAVLGLTTRFDVAEALEKRVKSRFSHRQVYVPLAKNFSVFKEMCKAYLLLFPSDLSNMLDHTATTDWTSFVDQLFATSAPLNTILQSTYHTTKSVPAFLTAMLLPISTLPTSPTTAASLLVHLNNQLSLSPSLSPPDSTLSLLPSLSTLQLSLLIASARLVIIHDSDTITFPLAYDEYKSLASKARIAASASGALAAGAGARVWGQRVARMAWEGLVEKGLIVAEEGRRGVGRVDVGLEEIGGVVESGLLEGVGTGVARWCREI